jgi:hypothetical protein
MSIDWGVWEVLVGVVGIGVSYLTWRFKRGSDPMGKVTKKRTVKQAQRQSGGGVQVQKQQLGDALSVQAQREGRVQEQSQEVVEEND